MKNSRSLRLLLASAAAAVLLAGCSSADEPAAAGTGTSSAPGTAAASVLTVTDPWVKAADAGMTAAFGTIANPSDADVRIVSARTDLSSSMELHEMATGDTGSMVMQQKEGGFVVPAGGAHELSPGGDHLMLMDLTSPVQPGAELVFTLTAEDGSTLEFTAPARSFAGAQEEYAPGTGTDHHADHGTDHEADHEAAR